MYNYLKNGVSINSEVMATINAFNEIARTLATESVAHTTLKHELEDARKAIENNEEMDADAKVEAIREETKKIEAEDDRWTLRRKELDFALYGGKDKDGKKVDGVCSLVGDNLYKAYVTMVQDGKTGAYRDAIREFCLAIINGDNLKQGAENHLYNDILTTMSSVRYNSNSQIAQGAAFITTVNKRTYKKMLLGAIADIVANNKTLKVKKPKADK